MFPFGIDLVTATESDNVGNKKSMKTTATLFKNGLLLIQTWSKSGHPTEALRGHVLVLCLDDQGRAIWVSQEYRAKTRCAKFDFTCASSGTDAWTEQFPEAVGQSTRFLDIVHSEEGLGNHRQAVKNTIQEAKDIAQGIKDVLSQLG